MHAINYVKRIMRRYDAENDTVPGQPAVTWPVYDLAVSLEQVLIKQRKLQEQVQKLTQTVEHLKTHIATHEDIVFDGLSQLEERIHE